MKSIRRVLLLSSLIICWAMRAQAQAPDPTFTPTQLFRTGRTLAVAPQANGSIVALNILLGPSQVEDVSLVRYLPGGALDPQFKEHPYQNIFNCFSLYNLPNNKLLLVAYGALMLDRVERQNLMVLNSDGSVDERFEMAPLGKQEYISSVAVLPDGRLLLQGAFRNKTGSIWPGLMRLLPTGELDTSFTYDYTRLRGSAVAVQPDGKILLNGSSDWLSGRRENSVFRLLADGSPDTTFNCQLPVSVNDIQLQADGRVLVTCLPSDQVPHPAPLVRLLPNGHLDPSFAAPPLPPRYGVGGMGSDGAKQRFTSLADGRVVVAYTRSNSASSLGDTLICYSSAGVPDAAFRVGAGTDLLTRDVQPLPNGNVVVAGNFKNFDGGPGGMVVLNPQGRPAATFNRALTFKGTINALLLLPNGNMVIGGDFACVNGITAGNLALLHPDGTVDTAFTRRCYANGTVQKLLRQADGAIVVGGSFYRVGSVFRPGVARLLATGAVDKAFSVDLYPLLGLNEQAYIYALAQQPDGNLLISGGFTGNLINSTLIRVSPTGKVDNTFYPQVQGPVHAMHVLPDGRMLLGGFYLRSDYSGVVRLLANGTNDPTFRVQSEITGIYQLVEQPDHSLLVGGYFYRTGAKPPGMARVDANGVLDTSFQPTTPFETFLVRAMLLQPNGRILISGLVDSYQNTYLTARYMPNGTPDPTYTNLPNGKVNALLVQPDGKLLLAGAFDRVGGLQTTGLVRLVDDQVLGSQSKGTAATTTAYPNPARGQLHVEVETSAHPRRLTLLDQVGRVVRQQNASAGPQNTMDVQGVAAGLYVLQVEYETGVISRHIAIE